MGKNQFSITKPHLRPEHPHERGENVLVRPAVPPGFGTSPRAWGKLPAALGVLAFGRNIPTSVGKTSPPTTRTATGTEHPHERGENGHKQQATSCKPGTSPRAWGKQGASARTGRRERNIPTSVGKTSPTTAFHTRITEHPHERGENDVVTFTRKSRAGTSPRAWGKRWRTNRLRQHHRNIPTSVGKTVTSVLLRHNLPEHPHERGENLQGVIVVAHRVGTSPRAWGKLRVFHVCTLSLRNIPTSVGKTT